METNSRVTFLDNLRFLFVLLVVVQHAGTAYIGLNWWPVADDMSFPAAFLVSLFDAFLMPSLFFVAGYFAIPSIKKHGGTNFIKGKFRRLGIPWLACILVVCPILPLVYHYTRDGMTLTTAYFDRWKAVMSAALEFNIGMMMPMNQLMQNDGFYQRYMWFIGLLILLFLLFSLVYLIRPRWFEAQKSNAAEPKPSIGGTLKLFLAVGSLTLACSTVIIVLVMFKFAPGTKNPESWFTLGNLVQFRISRIFLHVAYFSMGVLAFRNGWLQRGRFPGHSRTWTVLYAVLAPALLAVAFLKEINVGSPEMMGLVYWVVLNYLTISSLGLFSSLAMRRWNRPTKLNRSLAANSYNLYLAHYPFVILLQLFLYQFPQIPASAKFAGVSLFAIAAALLLSMFVIKPRPGITLAGLAGIFTVMILMISP